jgi:hypothetical protein
MLANYVLNLIVIGLPAVKTGTASIRSVASGVVVLTVLAQMADRLGAMLALPASMFFYKFFGGQISLRWWIWPLVIANFLFSGIAVGSLALYFLRRRWHVQLRSALMIAGAAAILTNPAWMLFLVL